MKKILLILAILIPASLPAAANRGYYRFPDIHGDTVIFTSEGDLWKVPAAGGTAQRLTTHRGMESNARFSPDGKTIAFSGQYDGPVEVYTIPVEGGVPEQRTWEGGRATVAGWTPGGKIIYSTRQYSTLPNTQLGIIDPGSNGIGIVPLAQASEGTFTPDGRTLFFTRLPFQGSRTKRYRGGTIQQIWKYADGAEESVPLTTDFAGTSKQPMWWNGRVYFISDRDGTMNIWSIRDDGSDLSQHTFHKGYDVDYASLHEGKIVYQQIADIRILDIARGEDRLVPITISSDFDQMRPRWVTDPAEYITAAHPSPDGDRVVLTARGQVFVAPLEKGRLAQVTRKDGVRHRFARFMPDGKTVLMLSDESGETEFHTAPANGVGGEEILTGDGKVLRFEGIPSPDGLYVAYTDKDFVLWLLDVKKKSSKRIDSSLNFNFSDLAWSPDGKWLAYGAAADNQFNIIKIYGLDSGSARQATSDRVDCFSPAWSTDGKWLFFLSDRTFESAVRGPWGPRQPEPFFDRTTGIYMVSLMPGERSPFLPDDEAWLAAKESGAAASAGKKGGEKKEKEAPEKKAVSVSIDFGGIMERVIEVPAGTGNFSGLSVNENTLFWTDRQTGLPDSRSLKALKIQNTGIEVKTILSPLDSYELSLDGKRIMARKNGGIYLFEAGTSAPADLEKARVDLGGWSFPLRPALEWHQIFVESWRLERDYFYDRKMHGIDYDRLLAKYMPYVDRITDRYELGDLISHIVGELSALHTFVSGGDLRTPTEKISQGTLGARFKKDVKTGGFRISHIHRADPDIIAVSSPLARPDLMISEGDVITAIDGVSAMEAGDLPVLLRNKAGKQVLLSLVDGKTGAGRTAIVTPLSSAEDSDLRYHEWEYERRRMVDEKSGGEMGYVHLRAMGSDNMTEWVRSFYPVFNRKGLIIDVRQNRGGNIDSWILEKLLRRAWFYWKPRVGNPFWNMQYAFRGHIVVLCNEFTASDGEAFAEGFRRLGLGKVIGTRTWGGEIWLSVTNNLVDRGIASAAELGVYGPDGDWLIEGHGVDPDIVVDNPPRSTYGGEDAQLEAAMAHLRDMIRKEPVEVPPAPAYPDKSFGH